MRIFFAALVLIGALLGPVSKADSHDFFRVTDPIGGYKLSIYLWVVLWSLAGGLTGYLRKLKGAYCRFSITEFFGECTISVVVGLVTFWLCKSAGIGPEMTAVNISITSHMGTRALILLERQVTLGLTRLFRYKVDVDNQQETDDVK